MSDFFRRASDAFQHRPRQDSTDSTDSPNSKSPEARKPSVQDTLNQQRRESAEADSHADEAFAGTATENVARPKQRRFWGWRTTKHGDKPETKPQQPPSQERRDDTNWVVWS